MEKSEALSQQERLQAIAEKRKRQTEIENKKRQLEDDRRQLQHLKSKALRERWLLDGAPSAGLEEDEAKKQLQEDEAKTKGLEETILRLEMELEELERGVSATSTKENLSDAAKEENAKTGDNKAPAGSVKEVKIHTSPRLDMSGSSSDMIKAAMYSVEITVEKDRLTGETKVLSTSTLLPRDLTHQGVKVYEDDQKVVHEVRGGSVENGVHLLSSSEVDELIHKADEASMGEGGGTPKVGAGNPADATQTPKKEITGIEAKAGDAHPEAGLGEASVEHPVTMVFMGYQSVEDETETKKVLGLEGTVKAELVVIEDGENKGPVEGAKEDQAPPNGSAAEPVKAQEGTGGKGESEAGAAELNTKEKQPCKCCSIM
ncbi:paralemmin 1a isoform X2 [Scleropages formosus]|uniref:paralemmin 1a isoform X2 n=1 Tax=Scleropages formosus TaxID=113540 RepID=UPI000878A59E|nr:paralemmin-1 isoform X2 [Scleropages formosus]